MMAWSGPGIAAKALASPITRSAITLSAGINAVPMLTPSASSLPCSAASLSLRLSAPLAKAPVMVADRSVTALLPPFSSGIMSAPALPNNAIAAAVLPAPSGILANLSATSSMIASVLLSLPLASVALTPSEVNASAAPSLPVARFRFSLIIAAPTPSMLVPLALAAC